MGENGLLAPHRAERRDEKTHDGTIVTDKVNDMWGTDMTQTVTVGEGRAYVFVAIEHANSEIVGIHASSSANRFEALEPVRQGVDRCFGAIAPGVAHGLKLRHDHGSNYMSGISRLKSNASASKPRLHSFREPEGNGVAERFMRTLKENLLWVRSFNTIEELRVALIEFARRYNETWLVERHGYRSPAKVREEQTALQVVIDPTIMVDLRLAAEQAQSDVSKPCRSTPSSGAASPCSTRAAAARRSPPGSPMIFRRGLAAGFSPIDQEVAARWGDLMADSRKNRDRAFRHGRIFRGDGARKGSHPRHPQRQGFFALRRVFAQPLGGLRETHRSLKRRGAGDVMALASVRKISGKGEPEFKPAED